MNFAVIFNWRLIWDGFWILWSSNKLSQLQTRRITLF